MVTKIIAISKVGVVVVTSTFIVAISFTSNTITASTEDMADKVLTQAFAAWAWLHTCYNFTCINFISIARGDIIANNYSTWAIY